MAQQVVYIEVTVGTLPEWYDEAEHDYELERAIERRWHSNPAYAGAEVRVCYAYDGAHNVVGYDEDGNRIFERECDLDATFEEISPAEVTE